MSMKTYLLTAVVVVLVSGMANAIVVSPSVYSVYIADYYGNETVQAWIGDSNGPAPGSSYLNQPEPTDGSWMHFTIDVGSLGLVLPDSNTAVRATLLEPIDEGGGTSDYLVGVAWKDNPVLDIYFASDPLPEGLPEGIPSIDLDATPVMEIDDWQSMFGYFGGTFSLGAGDIKFYVKSIPEPATLSLLALGGLGVILRRSK